MFKQYKKRTGRKGAEEKQLTDLFASISLNGEDPIEMERDSSDSMRRSTGLAKSLEFEETENDPSSAIFDSYAMIGAALSKAKATKPSPQTVVKVLDSLSPTSSFKSAENQNFSCVEDELVNLETGFSLLEPMPEKGEEELGTKGLSDEQEMDYYNPPFNPVNALIQDEIKEDQELVCMEEVLYEERFNSRTCSRDSAIVFSEEEEVPDEDILEYEERNPLTSKKRRPLEAMFTERKKDKKPTEREVIAISRPYSFL